MTAATRRPGPASRSERGCATPWPASPSTLGYAVWWRIPSRSSSVPSSKTGLAVKLPPPAASSCTSKVQHSCGTKDSISASEAFAKHVRSKKPFAGGLTHIAVQRQAQVGKEEGGSNFTTIANQLAFLNYPELLAHTQESSFDPLILAGGKTDLFVIVPEETIEHVKGWLRLWVAIPNAVAGIKPLERDLLIVIDEMPRLGYLKPVMDGYTMAAGKGVHFWCFAQSISALD